MVQCRIWKRAKVDVDCDSVCHRDPRKILNDGNGVARTDMLDNAQFAIKTNTETRKSESTVDANSVEHSQKDVVSLFR